MLATAITHVATDTNASASGVAATSTPTRKIDRESVEVKAVTRTGRKRASR